MNLQNINYGGRCVDMARTPSGIVQKGDTKVVVDLGDCPGQVDIVLYQGNENRGCRIKIIVRDGYLFIDPGDSYTLRDESLTFFSASRNRRTLEGQLSAALQEQHGHPNPLLANEPGFEDLKHLVR